MLTVLLFALKFALAQWLSSVLPGSRCHWQEGLAGGVCHCTKAKWNLNKIERNKLKCSKLNSQLKILNRKVCLIIMKMQFNIFFLPFVLLRTECCWARSDYCTRTAQRNTDKCEGDRQACKCFPRNSFCKSPSWIFEVFLTWTAWTLDWSERCNFLPTTVRAVQFICRQNLPMLVRVVFIGVQGPDFYWGVCVW